MSYEGQDADLPNINVELGQANRLIWDIGRIEIEMIDKDNSFACHLIIAVADTDVEESDYSYTSADGDVLLEYSYLSIQKEEHEITEASIVRSEEDGVVFITATVVDDRGYTYQLAYYNEGFILTGETLQVVIDTRIEATYWDDDNEWVLHAENDSLIVHFTIVSSSPEIPLNEYKLQDVNIYASHIEFLFDKEENNWWWIGVHSVESFSIVGSEDSGYLLSATIVAEDGNVYEIVVGNVPQGIENIKNQDKKAVKRLIDGMVVIEKDGIRYTPQGTVIKN